MFGIPLWAIALLGAAWYDRRYGLIWKRAAAGKLADGTDWKIERKGEVYRVRFMVEGAWAELGPYDTMQEARDAIG